MAAANLSMSPNNWPSTAPAGCLTRPSPTSSRIPGANANQAVFYALLSPGDTFMGLDLAAGGHLTHGHPANFSGKWFKPVPYTVRRDDQRIDMDQVAALAREHKPKLILAGGSAYARIIDFAAFRQIADEVGALFMVDMAHFAGLVAGGVHPIRCPYADVVTTTTHKTLRGPRGGMILSRDEAMERRSTRRLPRSAGRALDACDRRQGGGVRRSAQARIQDLRQECGGECQGAGRSAQVQRLDIVTGGTDTHLMLVDLRPKGAKGRPTEHALDAPASPATRTPCPSTPKRPSSPPASGWVRRRHHPRLSARRIPRHRQADRGSGGRRGQE
jgi:glycine hydroxymethyltransferase